MSKGKGYCYVWRRTFVEVDIEVVETAGVEAGRTTDDAMDVVALFEEKLSSEGNVSQLSILSHDTRTHMAPSLLNTRVRCASRQPV